MKSEERAKLLRERLRAVRGYLIPWRSSPPQPEQPKKKRERGPYPYGVSLYERRSAWVNHPDRKPAKIAPTTKRTAVVSPLILIAREHMKRRPFG